MKFKWGLTRAERGALEREYLEEEKIRFSKWHRWFAWYPVRVGHRDGRWFEWVERKYNAASIQVPWGPSVVYRSYYLCKGHPMYRPIEE